MANVDRQSLTPRQDQGSVSVEVVLLAPLLVVLALFIVHLGSITNARLQLVSIADQAARAASLVHPQRMVQVGSEVAHERMAMGTIRCVDAAVDVKVNRSIEPGIVTVHLSCTVEQEGLSLLAPIARTILVTSSEVIDHWRVDS